MPFVTAAITLAQAGVSVYQALEAKSRMEEAEVAAKKASANALRQTEINPYEKLSVPTAEYMEQREAAQRMVSAGVQAGGEGDQRGAAATAATAVSAGLESEKDILASQERSLYNRDVAVAGQDAVNQIRREEIYTDMATGAQQSAADQAAARAAAITGAATGLSAVGAEIDAGRALYKKDALARNLEKGLTGKDSEQFKAQMQGEIMRGLQGSNPATQMRMAKSLGFTDATELTTALASEESFAPFYESLGTSQLQSLGLEYLTGLSNKNYRQMNRGAFLTPQSAGVAGNVASPSTGTFSPFDPRLDFAGYNFPK
jgi:hypothetical protein